jgi:hypothetical protein
MSGKEGVLRIEWKYAQDFKSTYATNIFGIAGDYDYRLIFGGPSIIMQQDASSTPKAEGEYKVEVVLPFRTMKELRNLLDNVGRDVELRLGEIKLPKKPEDMFKQP